MLALSLALHLVFFFLALNLKIFHHDLPLADKAIFVDVVNLPTLSPQAGAPAGPVKVATPASHPQPHSLPLPAPREMRHSVTKAVIMKTGKISPKEQNEETAQEYEERLSALQRSADARHQDSALAEIQRRISNRNTAGTPGGSGNQAGSDYNSYVQSRLKESFGLTIAWHSKKPLVVVRLTVDGKGVLTSYKIEKSNGDTTFEDAVSRAVQLAKKNFPAPPGGKEISFGFVFRPEGVDKK